MSDEDKKDQLISEMLPMIRRLEAAQKSVGETDKDFVSRFRNGTNELLLGSDRTFDRMKQADWENVSPVKWLGRVRHALTIVEGGLPDIEVYEKFPFFAEASKKLATLERQPHRRIMVALATTGCGKTIFGRRKVSDQPKNRRYVMASPAWREGRKGCKGEGNGPAIAIGMYQQLSGQRLLHTGYEEALALLTDKCSRKVVGYHCGDTLEAGGCLEALKQALAQMPAGATPIHHTDQGTQYCSHEYVNWVEASGLSMSMTERDHCAENALAERVNGILKSEYGLGGQFKTKACAHPAVRQAVHLYNTRRPHTALGYQTPQAAHTLAA